MSKMQPAGRSLALQARTEAEVTAVQRGSSGKVITRVSRPAKSGASIDALGRPAIADGRKPRRGRPISLCGPSGCDRASSFTASSALAKDVVASQNRWAVRDPLGQMIKATEHELAAIDDRTFRWALKKALRENAIGVGQDHAARLFHHARASRRDRPVPATRQRPTN
jgi:hypothetical protein